MGIVSPLEPVICWPWSLRDLVGLSQHPKGAHCAYCKRDVAMGTATGRPVCLYCAMDRGLIPAIDQPFDERTAP